MYNHPIKIKMLFSNKNKCPQRKSVAPSGTQRNVSTLTVSYANTPAMDKCITGVALTQNLAIIAQYTDNGIEEMGKWRIEIKSYMILAATLFNDYTASQHYTQCNLVSATASK